MRETVTHYIIKSENKALQPGGFRAVFLSDMHNCIWKNDVDYLIELIEDEKPDIILCGGDMLVAHPTKGGENLTRAAKFIGMLSQKQKVYYAFGNHEYRLRLYPEVYGDMYAEYMDALKDFDVCFLDNECVNIDINQMPVSLYGLSISRKYYQRFVKNPLSSQTVKSAIGEPAKDRLNILLAHHPKYLGAYMKWGADVILSGHYHGGVAHVGKNKGLVSPDPSIFTHCAYGCIEMNGKTAVISAGMGEHTIPFRINNPREIVVLDVEVW